MLDIWPILAFMAVQTVGITWWAATMTARVGQLEVKAETHDGDGERLAKIETSIEGIQKKLDEFVIEWRKRRS